MVIIVKETKMKTDKEFKDLTTKELSRGYIETDDKNGFECIFCSEKFEKGLIYNSRERLVTAERAAYEHVFDFHKGSFNCLINLDKQINGLSDIQKSFLNNLYLERDSKDICKDMDISAPTVRTHKFNIQKMKREAKILLAILEQIENEELVNERKKSLLSNQQNSNKNKKMTKDFQGNALHPFFKQFDIK